MEVAKIVLLAKMDPKQFLGPRTMLMQILIIVIEVRDTILYQKIGLLLYFCTGNSRKASGASPKSRDTEVRVTLRVKAHWIADYSERSE